MKVEIKANKNKAKTFNELKPGDCFYLAEKELLPENIKIKIKEDGANIAVTLYNGERMSYGGLTAVIPLPKAKIVIK